MTPLQESNWFGFDIDKCERHFEGELTFVGEFSVEFKDEWRPCAVFHNAKPNREKNHKDYLLLFKTIIDIDSGSRIVVSGKDKHEIDPYQSGKRCRDCGVVIYSVARHDYRSCQCGKVFVDGGRDYFRASVAGDTVKINLLEQSWEEVTPEPVQEKTKPKSWEPLLWYRTEGLWWFRFFGYGLRWKRVAQHPLLYSERAGGGLRVGEWHFRPLRRSELLP